MTVSERIEKISIDPEFNTYYFNTFRYKVGEKMDSSKEPVVFMGDINDLYILNQRLGKKSVNQYINEVLNKIRDILKENKKEHVISKLGDEIYIFLDECNEEEERRIKAKISDISVHGVTLSVGSAKAKNNYLGLTIEKAEDDMMVEKKKYKAKVVKEIYGDNLKKLLKYLIDNRLARSRFDLNEMDEKQIKLLTKRLERALDEYKAKGEVSYRRNYTEEIPDDEEMYEKYIAHIEKYQKRSIKKFGKIDPDYVFEKIVSYDVEEGCINDVCFNEIILPERSKDEFAGKTAVLCRISGVKQMNDKYGHDACDKEERRIIRKVKKYLKKHKNIRNSPVVVRGIKEFYFFVNSDSKVQGLINEINNHGAINKELMVQADSIEMKDNEKFKSAKELIDAHMTTLREKEEHEKYSYRTQSEYHIAHFINAIKDAAENNALIQAIMDKNPNSKEKIIEYMKGYFLSLTKKRLNEIKRSKPQRSSGKQTH